MRLFWSRQRAPAATGHVADVATARRDALAHAALALADVGRDTSLEAVLRITVDAAARITGAATALALAADGRLERFVANGLDGCTRDTLARVDVLGALVARLHALARPLAPEDLDPVTAGVLLAVAPHGVVVVEPRFPPGVLDPARIHTSVAESPGLSVCRMSHIEIEGRLSHLHFEYLIGRPAGIQRASEVHELGLFTVEETMACFRRAGFEPEHDTRGLCDRGLYIAR